MALKGTGYAAEAFAAGPLAFVSPSHFVMSVGNALRLVPTSGEGEAGERAGEKVLWSEGASVGAIDASSAHGIVAYAERQRTVKEPRIFVCNASDFSVRTTVPCEGELGIIALAVCNDPKQTRLVSLGEIPDHNITVWDWSSGGMMAKVSAQGSRARSVSFDPLDCNAIASVGSKLELWALSKDESGDMQLLAEPATNIDKEDRELTAHCWAPDKTLFLASDSGEICHVNARTGSKVHGTKWTQISMDPIYALALASQHLLVGSSEGSHGWIHWVSYPQAGAADAAYTVERTAPKVDGPVTALSVSPDFQSLAIATAQGTVAVCELPDALQEGGENGEVEKGKLAREVGHGFPDGGVNAMAGMTQLPVVVTAGQRGNVTLWMAPSLQIISTLIVSSSSEDECTCVAVADEARVVVAGTSGGEVTAIDVSQLAGPRLVHRARLHPSPVTAISMSQYWIASAAAGQRGGETYIALSSLQSSGGSAAVTPIGRVKVSGLLHMQVLDGVLLATNDSGELIRMQLPAPSAAPSTDFLKLATETGHLSPAPVISFSLQAADEGSAVKIVGWCADRGLRCWSAGLTGALSADLISEWKGCVSHGSAVAVGQDHRGNAVVFAGARDGSVTVRSPESLAASVPVAIRHLGAAAAVKGGLSAEPSANLQYEPLVVARGGVSGVAVGAGVLRGWVVSSGREGSLISQALDDSLPPPRPSLPPRVPGLLSAAPQLAAAERSAADGGAETTVSPLTIWEEWEAVGGAQVGAAVAGGDDGLGARGAAAEGVARALTTVKTKFQDILEQNKTCPDIERLERAELTIDVAEKARMVALADSQARHVSLTIQRENALRELRARKIRAECCDTMDEAALLALVPIDATATVGLQVLSFSVPKTSEIEEARLRRIRLLRRFEMKEQALAKEAGLAAAVAGPEGLRMTHAEMQRIMSERGGKSGGGAAGGGGGGGDEDGDEEGEGDDDGGAAVKPTGDEGLLYDSLELTTRERRLNQIELQRCRIRGFKTDFNEKLRAGIKDKSSVIDKLDEKKTRLAEIKEACDLFLFPHTGTEKLQVDDTYGLAPSEEGKQLTVADSEISAPKYLSAAERAAKEAEEAEEAARKAAAGSDDAVGRALNDMMFGTLEARKQDEHNIFEEKPPFYDTPAEQLSDDQIKQCREYDRKEKLVRDAEETQRKALEAEAKKIKTDMQQLITDFHGRLGELANHKLQVRRLIDVAELEMVLLWQAVVRDEDREIRIRQLARQADTAQLDHKLAGDAVAALREEIDEFRLTYETVLTEDKAGDKAFKKEIADSPMIEELTKLFKKRSYPHQDTRNDAGGGAPSNPFAAIALAKERAFPRPEALDWEAEVPDMSPVLAQRLHELREKKIDSELMVKKKAAELMELNARLEELSLLHKEAAELCDSLTDDLQKLYTEREMQAYNLALLLDIKQGQVEVDVEQLLDENFDAALMEVSHVSKLNAMITRLGSEKVDMMTEQKSVSNKIHGLNWHNNMLDFKALEVTENIKYVQLLFVTKDLQSVIKGGADDRKQRQIQTLEKQMEHCQHLHELKVQDMKARLFRAHKQIREKELENNKLAEYVQDLAVSVAQREKIMRVRRSEEQSNDDREYKMQEVVWRRLVLEEARQQSEDIAILKAEVDRLRQRTFPSFAKNYSSQHSLR